MKKHTNPYDTGDADPSCYHQSAYCLEYLYMRAKTFADLIVRGETTVEKAAELMHMQTGEFMDFLDDALDMPHLKKTTTKQII